MDLGVTVGGWVFEGTLLDYKPVSVSFVGSVSLLCVGVAMSAASCRPKKPLGTQTCS